VIQTYKYVIYAEVAESNPLFVGFTDTIEEARKIKFDAELAGFARAAIVDGKLNEVE
jgi:Xaa-Pro aminopeptidase